MHVKTAPESYDLNIMYVHLTIASNSYAHRYLQKNEVLLFSLGSDLLSAFYKCL